MSFGSRLRERRESLGLKQNELGNLLGITGSAIGNYENGVSSPKADILYKVFDVLQCDANFLFQDEMRELETDDFTVPEIRIVRKYRALDGHGKDMVDVVLEKETSRMQAAISQAVSEDAEIIQFSVPEYEDPMSAGTGQPAGYGYGKNLLLIKEPPRGTSYVAPIAGDSMEPTFHDGDRLFIQACYEINVGEVGVFLMDGQQWVKELGEGVLLSHNPKYDPRPMTEDIRCQGRVLGVCDGSYLEI